MTSPTLKPGDRVWRIAIVHQFMYPHGPPKYMARACEIVRVISTDLIQARPSRFARNTLTVKASDVFPDREACRAEIQRRANGMKEATDG